MGAQRFDFCVDPISGVWLYFAGHHKSLADKWIAHISTGRRRLIGLNAHQPPQLRPDHPVFLAVEPLMDVPVQRFSEIRELCKIKAHTHSRFKFRKVSVEPLTDSFAGCTAYHGNIHCSQILLKGGNTAVLDGFPKVLPGLRSKALHLNDLRPVLVQGKDVHIGVEPAFANEFFQDRLRKPHNVQRLRACKVDELAQLSRFTMLVVAEQRRRDLFHPVYSVLGHVDASGLLAARASGRNDFVSGVAVSIQILLHMGNDLIPLAHFDAASRHQLQFLDEREVMKACPGYCASVDLNCVKDGYRSNFPCAAGRPFNRAKDCLISVVLKLERKPILIVMPGSAAGSRVGGIVVGNHNAVNGYVVFLRVFPQMPDTGVHIKLRQRLLARQIFADGKAELFDGPKPL